MGLFDKVKNAKDQDEALETAAEAEIDELLEALGEAAIEEGYVDEDGELVEEALPEPLRLEEGQKVNKALDDLKNLRAKRK